MQFAFHSEEEVLPGLKRMSFDHHIEKLESPTIKRVKVLSCSAAWNNERQFRPIESDENINSAEVSPFHFKPVPSSSTTPSTQKFYVKSTRPKLRCFSPTDEVVLDRPDSLLRRSLCPQPQAFE